MRLPDFTIDGGFLEPQARTVEGTEVGQLTSIRLQYSAAVSLKRIADVLCSTDGLASILNANTFGPYGEGLQNSIERGNRGINTNG